MAEEIAQGLVSPTDFDCRMFGLPLKPDIRRMILRGGDVYRPSRRRLRLLTRPIGPDQFHQLARLHGRCGQLYVPELRGLYEELAEFSYPFVRLCFGAFFVPHGWARIIGGAVRKHNEAGVLTGGTAAGMAKRHFLKPGELASYIGILELVEGTPVFKPLLSPAHQFRLLSP